jgi:tRNA (guanine-N(7)-)-methyltransferase subunit TRM82
MPKRICAIVFTPDEQSLLVGDKFGDVYLLPLEPDPDWTPAKTETYPETPRAPSATELTVHTKGNLEALKQQRKLKVQQPRKEGIQFESKLLLGHVSLLTDVAITEVPVDFRSRQYVLTADRDEHIRVSRGVTQAHVIENYCLGHREFVSKLCIVPWNADLLVAGSGEPALKVYHWRTGKLLDSENFEGAVREDVMSCFDPNDNERSVENLAISNIWPVHYTVAGNAPQTSQAPRLLLVAIEG